MNIKRFFPAIIILCTVSFLYPAKFQAQTLAVGTSMLEDYYRRAQLMGEIDSDISFVVRPIFSSSLTYFDNLFDPEFELKNGNNKFDGQINFANNKGIIKVLPISIYQQFNSHHPEGINDGAMIPARGYQNLLSMGIYVKYGPLSIQFQPEFVYAQNKPFEGFRANYTNPIGLTYPLSPYGNIDLPENFGNDNFSEFFWGQSSIRLTFGALSFGLSNESLWWGPGIHNSLLMSNTAPGFMHFTFNTVRPVKTPIGSFEWQIIGGRLESSSYTLGLPDDWRYINAMVLSYQPKWVPGLFVGLLRSFTVYKEDMGSSLNDYLPVIIPFGKNSAGGSDEDAKGRDQIASVFMRWLWTKSHAEIYVEYGRNDHAWNSRDIILQASHSAAYILGFRKLIPLNKHKGSFIQVNVELTQLEANPITINRSGGSWYTHSIVKHGYTHLGQLLGAGIGSGSNLQTLNISWVQSLKTIGIQFDRYVHNNDFYNQHVKDIRMNWVDMSATAFVQWDYKHLLFDLKLKFAKSYNYQWVYEPKLGDPSYFWEGEGWDVFNLHARLGVTYRF